MRILYVMHLKANPKLWKRLGDMKIACEMSTQLGDDYTIDVVGDYSTLSSEEYQSLREDLHANSLIDMSEFSKDRHYIMKMFKRLKETQRLDSYDLIHIHTSKLTILKMAMKYCKQQQPIVVSFHSPPESLEMTRFYKEDVITFCNHPRHAFVCNSPSHKQRCLEALRVPEEQVPALTYVYNGITDIYEVTNVPHSKRKYAGGTISRINSIKSAYESLVFLHKLSKFTNKLCFFIGSVAEYEWKPSDQEYYQKCLPLLSDGSIEWIRSATPDRIAILYSYTDVNVVLGRLETFGLPVVEAGLSGVPSLVLNTNGTGDIVEDGWNGYKLTVSKPIKWKSIYEEGLEKYKLCNTLCPEEVREYTERRFSSKRLAEEISKIYEKVGGANGTI